MIYRACLALTLVSVLVSAADTYDPKCKQCDAHGELWEPNKPFTYQENCREYYCKCDCDGHHDCPEERVETFCQPSNPQCGTCWAGGEMREGGKQFKFVEGCYQFNCLCNCDGAWNCPNENTINVCTFNVTSGCHYCDVFGVKYEGNSHFKHVNGCIDYDCTCNCDGSWNCPGERAVDTCNLNPRTGCYYCEAFGKRFEGNSHFKHVNGCIEYNCVCNCDGGWDCPGDRAVDTCLTNPATGCHYCNVYGYLYEGGTTFPLIDKCFEYSCDCKCNGGWTCEHSRGTYICDYFGNEPISECRSCTIDNKNFRGDSRFFYDKGCVTYKCSCDCGGRHYCAGSDAFYTCPKQDSTEVIASLSSSYSYTYTERTRSPRQTTGCLPCVVNGKQYDTYETFTKRVGCNSFTCTCLCSGQHNCPTTTVVNTCAGPTGGGSGASTFGSDVDPEYTQLGVGTNICIDCAFRGETYTGNSKFSFDSMCWRYHCNCYCNGSIECPSDRSENICPGKKECVKCVVDQRHIDPNTDFELSRGCVYYNKCRCSCDGGWTCDDGEYTCDTCQGCKVDERTYAGNSSFVLTRGCDRYTSCFCGCDSKWQCSGEVEDLCGACRKCNIGYDYYEGGTTFPAQVGCTRYRSCTCNCDGSYRCVRGSYTCDERGDLPVEDQCVDCVHGTRRYRPEQRFDYEDNCLKYTGCQCKCGKTTCTTVEDTCGNCRSCLVDSTEYRGGTKFSKKTSCLHYQECDCFCSGEWKCYGESAVDTCNTCKKCNVDDVIHDAYSGFELERGCWRYHCFCGCDGSTRCPSETAINTCTKNDVCYTCDVDGLEYRGNTLFTNERNELKRYCKCNCDGSYYCIAEWLYIKTDLTISGTDLSGCFFCSVDGRRFRGNTNFTAIRDGFDLNCQCFCNGGYYCYGEKKFESTACRGCSLFGLQKAGDSEFSLVYNGFKLACQCECDGTYMCYGTEGTAVISCIRGVGCLPQICGQCVLQGQSFNGGDVFGSTYKGRDVRCECGCDGSYYCEGSGGLILSCRGGRCEEFGCTSCQVFDLTYQGDAKFEIISNGMKLDCQCKCGGNYRCSGSSGEIIVSCLDGTGCLPVGTCNMCQVNGKDYTGRSTFRYNYEGIDVICSCSCDGSYYCKGVYELIEIACIGGRCTRLGCKSCNIYGLSYPGDSDFNIVYGGVQLNCRCQCSTDYSCVGTTGSQVISCIGGRNCLPATCGTCSVNNKNYAGRSTFRSQYKGIDLLCTCGCDSSAYCSGTTTSIEVTCVGGSCSRVGCRECSLFGKEYLGSSQFDIAYGGQKLACECDCEGGYICRGRTGVVVITCVNGVGAGCLNTRCSQCEVEGRSYPGFTTFNHVYQGIDMKCSCSCDGSYYCEGISELIAVSCVGGTCTPVGCKTCRLYDKQINGATPFNIIYGGYSLDCMCNCDGSYRCLGEGGVVVLQCRDNMNCLPAVCQGCLINSIPYRGGTTFPDVYNGIDVTCTCGCDSSYICQGVSTKLTLSCVGGRCNAVGCQGCSAYGRTYASFQKFEIYHRGMRLSCDCDCNGGYECRGSSGEVFVRCRDGINCLDSTCNSCRFNNQDLPGLSVFKYDYNGIGMSCTCACDGSIFCFGVTEQIEISCIGGTCTPSGCRSCNVLGTQIDAFASFTVVHEGKRLDCNCACDSSFKCTYKNREIINCPAGQGDRCFAPQCRECVVDGRRYQAKSVFAHTFENIDMKCTCGCDGSSYCEGIRVDIIVSCIGGTCSPVDCKSCSIFGQTHQAYTPFRMVHQGVWLDCSCACDSSFICRGKTGTEVVNCKPGENCFPSTCQDCFIDGRQIGARRMFPYSYEGIDMTCTCGCDGTAICEGIQQEIIISCVGGNCSPVGCRDCVLFGRNYPAFRSFNLIYDATDLDCTCACDSSFVCYGKSKEEVIRCRPGENCATTGACRTCYVGGAVQQPRSVFAYRHEDIDLRCTCGCDGSAYCEGVTEKVIVGCIGGTCSFRGCRSCSLFGNEYPPYKSFPLIYDATKLDCTCSCDSSFVCYGKSKEEVLRCRPGETCPTSGACRTCYVGGSVQQPRSGFAHKHGDIDLRCTCGCDGSAYCEGVTEEIIVGCIGGTCSVRGCRTCNIFGTENQAYTPFSVVTEGTRLDCTCKCDSSFICYGRSGEKVVDCKPGQNCFPSSCTRDCIVEGRSYRPRSTFSHRYNDIDLKCTCGCDATAFCEGVSTVYFVSCIGERCFPLGCENCNLFGKDYQGDSSFSLVHAGLQMNCQCNCDTSWRCEGKSGQEDIDCKAGKRCLPNRCRKCRVGKTRYDGQTTFQWDYQNIRMNCVCGCDGTYYCKGVSTSYEIACPRRGPCRQVGGCRTCNIFGSDYHGGSSTDFVYQGYQISCTCNCDSSFKCIGTKGNVVVDCGIDQNCLINSCGPCQVDRTTYRGGAVFDTVYMGNNLKCTCGCDGSYFCRNTADGSEYTCTAGGVCTRVGCATCLSDGRSHQADAEFEKYYDGIRMNCLCSCDGSYRCQGVSVKVVILCTGGSCSLVGCRSCVVDGQEHASGSDYLITANRRQQRCRCECDGTSTCRDDRPACTECVIDGVTYPGHSRHRIYRNGQSYICDCQCSGESECNQEGPVCRQCNIFGQNFPGNREFETTHQGTVMKCRCSCDGSFECRGGGRVCTAAGCVADCQECNIVGQRHAANTVFDTTIQGTQMNCRCNCDGSFECRGGGRLCTASGCVADCQQCNIVGQRHAANTVFDTTIQGTLMNCRCNCDGSFECRGGGRLCTASGCVADCQECNIVGQRHAANTVFDTTIQGTQMNCRCNCDGSFECRGGGRLCTASGCVADCQQCNIVGQRHAANTVFDTTIQGTLMNCRCNCDGSFECRGGGRLCTASGCVADCQECNIVGQRHAANTVFDTTIQGTQMNCKCNCDGSFECRGGGRLCTTSGCVADCQQCNIVGQRHAANTVFDTTIQGTQMNCRCNCDGSFECRGGGRLCTASGCVADCQQCNIFSQLVPGNTAFDTTYQGTVMKCRCECDGSFECRGGGKVCTAAGCTNNCPGCSIEDRTYQGGTNFDIFHNGYGIRMNCDCECSGSYRCTGTKQVTAPCPNGDCSNTCFDCKLNDQTYRGNTRFVTDLDGIRMQCTCHCTGGYTCEGQMTSTSVCTGPACLRGGCTDCSLEGKTYPSNTDFEIQRQGMTMECSCACNGTLVCQGERREKLCAGSGCEVTPECRSCNFNGNIIPGNSRFQTVQNGLRQLCDCDCSGRLNCNNRGGQCTGPGCQTTGCRVCKIDNIQYSGNTRFVIQKNNYQINCTCFCDGTYSCKGTNGFEYSCLGDECPSDQCRACKLDGLDYQLDDKFRLAKNDLYMNCVCECDGAYRCFSISGYCTGPDCDDHGCSSCIIGDKKFKGNSRFLLQPGTTCECDCSGEYRCNSTSLGFQCVGADCGVGGCKTCLVDNERKPGNTRFQIKTYGLFMQCACNCDSTFTCRGYQIISDGTSPVDIPCTPCVINGKKYNPMTRFQALIDGSRKVCSCNCRGQHSCHVTANECRNCVIGRDEYQSNSDFTLYRGSDSIRCRCNCNGDFVCEGQGTCPGGNCDDGCRDCLIFGTRHKGGTRFYTGNDPQLLCECMCTGEYNCKGYRAVTKVLLAPEPDVTCSSCEVGSHTHPGESDFKLQRGCFAVDCRCDCDGTWRCPRQIPTNVCNKQTGLAEKVYYSLAGDIGSTNGPISFGNTKATLVYRDETSSTIFGQGGGEDCGHCIINGQQFDGNRAFVAQDGCLRWTCLCECNGGINCSSVEGLDCDGPLDPFERKSCYPCKVFGNTYQPETKFTADDECYRYSCQCNCDGSYECPADLTVQTCADTASVYDASKGTCRECVLGEYRYQKDEKFAYIRDCSRYICTCKCDGQYFCPASTAVRVCRAGSGAPGGLVTAGSRTDAAETKQTFVALTPVGTGSASYGGSSQYGSTGKTGGTAYGGSSQYGSTGKTGGTAYGGSSQYGSTGKTGGTAYGGSSQYGSTGNTGGSATSGSTQYKATSNTGSSATGGSTQYKATSNTGGSATGTGESGGAYSGSSSSGSSYGASSTYVSETTETKTSQTGSESSFGGSIDLSSLLTGGSVCQPCEVNQQTVPGGRDFTHKVGCYEYLCECFCNGTHVCPPERTVNICTKDQPPSSGGSGTEQGQGQGTGKGCKLGNRVYTTQLFSYTDTEKCVKFVCRCFSNGSFYCDPNKSKKIC